MKLQTNLIHKFLCLTALSFSTAFAFDGLVVTELPIGGDVTIPGDYPVVIPKSLDVLFQGISSPQSLNITNTASGGAVVKIFAQHEKQVRTINIQPGTSAVYSFKSSLPVRLKVISGDVKVSSIHPLKVQR